MGKTFSERNDFAHPTVETILPTPAVLVRGVQNGVGKTIQRESFAHPAPDDVLPTPPERVRGGQKKRGRPSADRRGGWIEFPIKNGRRYPRRRQWVKKDGKWIKESRGKATELDIMTEQEYRDYAQRRDRARAARARDRQRRSGH